MKVKVLGCSGGVAAGHDSTCMLIGEELLIDAGTGARRLTPEQSLRIKDIVVSHSHLDHIASICFLADQDIENRKESTRIHALPETASAIRRYVVNEIIWPEIEKVIINGVQMVEFHPLRAFETVEIHGCRITPLPVHHALPTLGFCFHGAEHSMVFISDMISASDDTWAWINQQEDLKYFITETAFPNHLEELARISKHLTPEMFIALCQENIKPDKLKGLELYATHLKPLYAEQIRQELKDLEGVLPIKPLEAEMEFEF